MEEWKNGRIEEWKNERMEEWKNGRMEEWKNGRMEEWKMTVALFLMTSTTNHPPGSLHYSREAHMHVWSSFGRTREK